VGHVWVSAVIRNPATGKEVPVKALVDTGATLSVVPRSVAEELGLPVIGKRLVSTAKGSAELDECVGVVEVMGRKAHTHVLVSDEVDVVLIGVTALEILGLEVDPVTGRLREAKVYLL